MLKDGQTAEGDDWLTSPKEVLSVFLFPIAGNLDKESGYEIFTYAA